MTVEVDGSRLKGKGRKIRCYDYVNHPYERVRRALKKNALIVFQTATNTAASRAQSVAAELRVDFAVSASRRISRLIQWYRRKSRPFRFNAHNEADTEMGGRKNATTVSA